MNTTTTATLTEISDSNDLVWEAVCAYDDGADWLVAWAMVAGLCAADRAIFLEEKETIDAKRWAAGADARYAAKVDAGRRASRAAANCAAACRDGSNVYAGAILACQELDDMDS